MKVCVVARSEPGIITSDVKIYGAIRVNFLSAESINVTGFEDNHPVIDLEIHQVFRLIAIVLPPN